MNKTLRQTFIIARRDFLAVVATPTFLLFLLAPLFMIGIGAVGGGGAEQVARSAEAAQRVAIVAAPADVAELQGANDRIVRLVGGFGSSRLEIVPVDGDGEKVARGLLASTKADYVAVMWGPLATPTISYGATAQRQGDYLAELAEQALRSRKSGVAPDVRLSKPELKPAKTARTSVAGRQMTGYMAVFGIFFLTILLAGQGVGTLAEEKSNKVIEILAAAVPLEAIFLGKLLGMFGVALLFVGFWSALGGIAFAFAPSVPVLGSLAPAIGLPAFLTLFALYFTMAYLLLGAVFLGVGGQAATIREIQMLSLPITIFQVGMFGLASAAAGSPGSSLARFAEWFPFSSPFAMAAHAATDAALWPHLVALVWQAAWVALTIWFAARLFRVGVLKSGSWRTAFGLGRRLAKRTTNG